jgi:hypothetical protein
VDRVVERNRHGPHIGQHAVHRRDELVVKVLAAAAGKQHPVLVDQILAQDLHVAVGDRQTLLTSQKDDRRALLRRKTG